MMPTQTTSSSSFKGVRNVLGPEFAGLSDQQLAATLKRGNIDADAAEGFLDDLGQFAAKMAPAVLPVAGQALGTVIGGPAGGALGGQLGSLAGGLFGQSEAAQSALPRTRAVLGKSFEGMSDADLGAALRNRNINPVAAEGFLDDLGQFAAKMAPVVLPVAGRALGTVIGGPAGGALGGQLGSLAGGLFGQSEAAESALPRTRAVLGKSFEAMSDADLGAALRSRNINPVAAEGFLDDLGQFAAKMAPVVLPVAGRALGTVIGGPAGGALGGQLGSLAGGLFGQSEAAESALPRTRAVLGKGFEGMSDADLGAALRSHNINPVAAEGFFDDLGNFARKMAPVVLPVAGRVLGTVVGGPGGGALGGQLGSLAGGLFGQSEAAESALPRTRAVLGKSFEGMSDADLGAALRSHNINPVAAEGFFDDLGRFARKMAPVVLPVAGRVLGTVVGGPAGGALGGQLGSLAGGLVTNLGQSEAFEPPPTLLTQLPQIRIALGPQVAGLSDPQLSMALARQNINAQAAEGFLDDLGSFAAKMAPVVLPVAGKALGTVIGGPAGGALGGQLGSLAGGLFGQSEAAEAAEAVSEWEAEADAAEALEIAELTEAYGLETEEA